MIILLKYISLFIYPLQFSRNSESLAIDSLQFPLSFSGLGGGNKEGAEGGGGEMWRNLLFGYHGKVYVSLTW